MSALLDLDPTGTLSAAASAIGLVGAVLRAAPAIKNATSSRTLSASGPQTLHRYNTSPAGTSVAGATGPLKDPERERRAYETVNYVLREFGSRLCAAGLVDEHALTRALMAATKHIEVNLFSAEANRLFESLAPRLGDAVLVNSVFTSIYFIGAITAELTSSLPNYKESYLPIGPRLVQQLFRTAIGEDAFRENLSANLDAYKTLATTAGLLRPTDIGYSTFPKFPSFSPSRYSSKSFGDVRGNKSIYEKLCKHFERAGFPQPNQNWQAEVGIIRDWKFLTGDTNSKNFDVEKADKNIGENFGRVIHWLICSADRVPPGQAIIAYYEQHIELIKWIGTRMGYCFLQPFVDISMTGAHAQLDNKLKAVMNTWVIIMPSERARAAKQATSAIWTEERERVAKQAPKIFTPPPQAPQPPIMPVDQKQSVPPTQIPSPPSVVASSNVPQPPTNPSVQTAMPPTAQKTIEMHLAEINAWFNSQLKPLCQVFLKMPPPNAIARDAERKRLTELTEKDIIFRLDALQIPEGHPAREQRKAMIEQAQKMLSSLDSIGSSAPPTPVSLGGATMAPTTVDIKPPFASPASELSSQPSTSNQTSPTASPPPYSPTTSPAASAGANPGFPFLEKRNTVIRRKAPPPPKKTIAAKALYDFEPDADNEEELAFKEGDDIEIIEKTAALEEEGWCRARIKGAKKNGLAPLEYLEIIAVPTQAPGPVKPAVTAATSSPGSGAPVSPPSEPAQSSASAQGIPNPSSQYPNHLGSQALSAGGHKGPIEVKNKIGKWEVAGLSLAGIGAAAGVATVLQSAEEPAATHTQTEVVHSHQNPAGDQSQNSTNNPTDSNDANPTNPTTQPSDGQEETPTNNQPRPDTPPQQSSTEQDQPTATNEAMTSTSQTESTSASSDYYYDANPLPPPATDLSAYSGGFEPQSPLTAPNPVADLAAIDPFYASTNPAVASAPDFQTTLATQEAVTASADTVAVENIGPVSPFASLATQPPVDTGLDMGVQDSNVMVSPFASLAKQPSMATTAGAMDQDMGGFDSSTEVSTVDVGDGSDWQLDSVEETTSYEDLI